MTNADFWYVMLQDGDVHRVTLDQLDEAFQAGHIDAETLVLAAGARSWQALGELAGLEGDAPVEVPFRPLETPMDTVLATPITSSVRPVSMDLTEVEIEELVGRRSGRGRGWAVAAAAVACAATLTAVAVQRPSLAQTTARNAASYASVYAGRAAGALRAAGSAIETRISGTRTTAPPPATPAVAPAESPAPPVGTALQAAPVAAPSPPAPAAAPAADERFSAETKAKLLEADKQREVRQHRSILHPIRSAPHGHGKSNFGGFTTGGNPFDPLNSGIRE